jgi:hypothetical protein
MGTHEKYHKALKSNKILIKQKEKIETTKYNLALKFYK